ncbi:hypothetical protein DYH09_08740 [bacterium CPR1]|nr:hypothetical protein [bacterium CPR1]
MFSWLTEGFGKKKSAEAAPAPPSARELLEALTGEVKNLQLSVRKVDLDDPEAVKRLREIRKAEAAEAEARKTEDLHAQMRSDILAACAELKAGIDQAELDRLTTSMEAYKTSLMPALQERGARGDMFRAVIGRILHETGTMAWARLGDLLEKAGQKWPDPDGLTPGMSEAECQSAREKLQADIKEDFIFGKARLELLRGSVPVWRAAYPDRDSGLWRRTVLRGVGVAIRSRLLELVLSDMKSREKEIQQMVADMVAVPLQDIRAALERGVNLQEASVLLEETQEVCRQQATEKIWALVGPVARI